MARQILGTIIRDKRSLYWLDFLVRLGVGVFFIVAGAPKLLAIGDFQALIGAYGMVPEVLLTPTAVMLPILEIVFGVGLITNRRWGWYGIVVLLLLFILVLTSAIVQGLDIDCGCFGPGDPEHAAFSGLRVALGRDLLIVLLLIYSYWYQRQAIPQRHQRRR